MEEIKKVEMTAAEAEEFAAWKAKEAERKAKEAKEAGLKSYREMADSAIKTFVHRFEKTSRNIKRDKSDALDEFQTIIKLKRELLGFVNGDKQRSHVFTHSDGDMRITIGVNSVDNYHDTVNEGIEMVVDYINSLANDDNARHLRDMLMSFLSRDKRGNLSSSKVLELSKYAKESGNKTFLDGVKLIEQSYIPSSSSTFIKAEKKNDKGMWVNIPLNVTEVNTDHEGQALVRGEEYQLADEEEGEEVSDD